MANHYDLTDFRVFVNVAEARSLTRGAERSCLSVPATSNRIKNLEENLGLRLLERSPQGISLTPEGHTYIKHARTILAQLDLLSGDLQEYAEGIKGKFRLLANTTAVTEYLPPVIGSYLTAYPNVEIDMRERVSTEIVQLLREQAADIGILSGNVETHDLQTLPFVSSRLVAIAPLGHELARQSVVKFERTLDFDHVSLSDGSAASMFFAQRTAAIRRTMNIRVQVSSYDAMFRMVEAGAGIALAPLACYHRLRPIAQVAMCHLADEWAIRDFRICVRNFNNLSRFVANFVTALTTTYEMKPAMVPAA